MPAVTSVQPGQRRRSKGHDRAASGNREPMHHVGAGLLLAERHQLVLDRHALLELPQLQRPQHRLQIRLADEDDLQQLLLVGLEVRQNADLLEDLQREVLRLVDDEQRAGAERLEREQEGR